MIEIGFRCRDVTSVKSKRVDKTIALGNRKQKDLAEDDTKMIESQILARAE